MAQDGGDPVITNAQEALSVSRPKLVAAFEAARSLHSGATAPAYTIDHQFWCDTTTDIVKQRNAANGAWTNLWKEDAGPVAVIPYAKTAHFTVDQPGTYLCDATSGAITATLPAASASKAWFVLIVKTDSSVNAVTVTRAGADTIEGATTVALALQYAKWAGYNNGATPWYKWPGSS